MEELKYKYNLINDWIKTADQKALILGSFNIAGFVFQLFNVENLYCANPMAKFLFGCSIIFTLVALILWLKIIYPRLDNKHKKSKIFFQHIANAYQDSIEDGVEAMLKVDEISFKRDLASQIVINSIIAKRKYSYIKHFTWTFVLQIVFIISFFLSTLN